MSIRTKVLLISDKNQSTIFFEPNSFKDSKGLVLDNFKFYFLDLGNFDERNFLSLFLSYFKDWFLFKKTISQKKIGIGIFSLDTKTPIGLKEIGFLFILKATKIPIIFESERCQEVVNISRGYLKKIFYQIVRESYLILPDRKMESIYLTYFSTSKIHYIPLQSNTRTQFNKSVKQNKHSLDFEPVCFYTYISEIEEALIFLEVCLRLKKIPYDFKFIITSKQHLNFLPQLNEQIRIANLMEKVTYKSINKINSGFPNAILIYQYQNNDNFFPQEVSIALFQSRVIIGSQELVDNGLLQPDINGSVFDFKQSNSLFNQMKFYLSNTQEIINRGKESKNIYHSYFSRSTIGEKLLSLFIQAK